MNNNVSFWERDSFCRPYDLIVIGAGIVGLSAALFYKREHPDARILVLDKGFIPEGASTRNAGFACIGSITEHMADSRKETGENITKRLKLRYDGLQLLRSTLGEDTIGYENCGGYEVFTSKKKFEEAADQIPRINQCMKNIADETEVYSTGEVSGLSVIRNRIDGALHPGRMMREWVRQVTAAGVDIRWNTKVNSIGEDGAVKLERGRELQAGQVLIASNGFTRRIIPELDIQPARGFVMVTQPWPDMPWKGTFNHDRGYIYFRNTGGRLLLGGARNIAAEEETTDQFGVNPDIKKYLQDFARDTLRLPETVGWEYEWSGIMGFTPTKTPVLRRLDDGRVVAAGLSGMGIAIGTKIGQQAARMLN